MLDRTSQEPKTKEEVMKQFFPSPLFPKYYKMIHEGKPTWGEVVRKLEGDLKLDFDDMKLNTYALLLKTMHEVKRFGGEEFILLVPEQSEEYTLDLIKHIQRDISQLPFKFREQNIMITLAAVSTSFKESDTPEYVLDRLGKMLADAKKRGTNQLNWS